MEKAEIQRFDAILTDISMPVMDGVQAARTIRAGNGASVDVPILAVTAHALPDEIRAFRDAGMNDVIGKPIVRSDLQSKLAKHCGAVLCETKTAAPDPKDVQPAPSTTVDQQRLRDLFADLGADTAQVLLSRFIAEAEETFAGIDHAKPQPVAELVPQLHKIAGSAAALGASALHQRLGQLEALGKTGEEQAFRQGLQDLAPIWAATRQEVSAAVPRA